MSKISELSDGGVIQGGDTLIAVRSGGNVKVTYGGSTTANIDGGTIDGTTIGGTTPAAGNFTTGSFTGDVSFGDNDKAIFGAGNDLQIFHDGSNSRIKDNGTGGLYVQGSSFISLTNASATETYVYAAENGAVQLKYDNATKLATTATGIDVTGTASTDGLTVSGVAYIQSTTTPQLELAYNSANITGFYRSGGDFQIKNDNGAGTPETSIVLAEDGAVSLYHDASAKLATTSTGIDVTGTVTADGLDVSTATGSSSPTPSKITIATTSAGSDWSTTNPWGSLAFYSADTSSGGAKEQVTLDTVAFNSSGGISDFRINTYNSGLKERLRVSYNGDISFYEDTGTTAKFFWDASAESLGIGTSSPSQDLEILNGSTGAGIRLAATGSAYWDIERDSTSGHLTFTDDGAGTVLTVGQDGNVGIGTSSPSTILHAKSASPKLLLQDSSQTGRQTQLTQAAGIAKIRSRNNASNGQIVFEGYTASTTSEYMRIDASGNLLVSGTEANPAQNNTTDAISLHNAGLLRASTTNAAAPLDLNVKSRDGNIATFRKDGSTVGSIGTHTITSSSRLYVGSGDVNLMFRPDIEVIQPASDTGLRDAAISLGNASGRFKDLYLSGGLHGDTTFKNNAGTTEYARFNSSGNLLVGKISTGTTNVGTQITGDGFTSIVGTNNNIPLYLENKGTNGNCRISFANNSHGGASLGLNNGGDFTIFDSTASTTRFNVTSSRVITASGGIAGIELGGVGVNNRLDDYEEGTFTPVVTGSTTAGTGTYSSQSGTYTKVGQVVTCSFAVNMTAHDGAGNIRISLPFSSNTNAVGVVMDQNLNYGSGASLVAFTQNQEFVQLYAVGDNLAWDVQTLADDTAFTLFVTITYRT